MTALTKDRDTPLREGEIFAFPLAAAAEIFAGSLVVLNAGAASAATEATGLIAVGRAERYANQAQGDTHVSVRRGLFKWANSAGADEITLTAVGSTGYIIDDQTVALTDGGGTRSAAGVIRDVDDQGVWVEI